MIKREEITNSESVLNKAADDEMLFVLLGRDPAAPAAIRTWIMERVKLGRNKWGDDQVQSAYACVEAMEKSQRQES